jgi:hypothetical protein
MTIWLAIITTTKKIARVNFNKNKKMYYEVLQRINECLL